MTEEFLTLRQVCEELQMSEPQVRALASSGQLETKEIEGETRFLQSSVADYKERVESKETMAFEGEAAEKAGAEEETDYEVPAGEEAELQLEEEETDIADEGREKAGRLDLSGIEEEPGADESDQTSVLQPVTEGAEETKEEEEPVFEFEEEEAPAEREEAAEEGEEGETVSLSPEDLEMEEGELEESEEPSHTEMVADILKEETGKAEEEESLETIDLAELEGGEEEAGIAEEVAGEAREGEAEETISLEEAREAGEEPETLLDVTAEQLEEQEEGEARPLQVGPTPAAGAAAMPGEYVMVQPSVLGNVLLAASGLIIAFGGFLAVSGAMGFHDSGLAKIVFDFIARHL